MTRRRIAVVAAPVAIVVGAGAVVAWQVADGSPGTRESGRSTTARPASPGSASPSVPIDAAALRAWQDRITGDLGPLTGPLIPLLRTIDKWRAGTAQAAAVRGSVRSSLPAFVDVLRAIDTEDDAPGLPSVRWYFRDAVLLYVESLRVAYAATGLPAGPLRHELQLAHARLRSLGDRLYDQGTGLVRAALPADPSGPGSVDVRPAPVPDWAALDLLPGPPIADAPAPARPGGAVVATARPTQPGPAWVEAVRVAAVPAAVDLAAAVRRRDVDVTRVLAGRLFAAADRLADTADPEGSVVTANVVRLGVLVDAEAALAAGAAGLAAGLAPPPSGGASASRALATVAGVLTVVGSRLWDPALLGPRDPGLPIDAVELAADAPL